MSAVAVFLLYLSALAVNDVIALLAVFFMLGGSRGRRGNGGQGGSGKGGWSGRGQRLDQRP